MPSCNEFFEFRFAGIPALINVTSFVVVPPWKGAVSRCPSDLDYHGYTEMEWNVCDRNGRPAPWLERKTTPAIEEEVEEAILEHFKRSEPEPEDRDYYL